MAVYASISDLIARCGEAELVEISARADAETTEIVDEVIEPGLVDADATINSYIAARHALPLAEVPAVLVRHGVSIARYYLWAAGASEKVRQDYEDALAFLKDVAAGRATLGIAAPQEDQTPVAGGVHLAEGTRRFTTDTMAGW